MTIYRLLLALGILLNASSAFALDDPCVVSGQGHFRIIVGTAGLFGAFAHDHLVEAQNVTGCATLDASDITRSSIKLTFRAADIKVVDPDESAENRAKIQKAMESDVLRASVYPQITFESTSIERIAGGNKLRVHGNLTIRGKTQPAVVPLIFTRNGDGSYYAVGNYSFKQTSFGIKPVKIAGGAIKVKDEVQTDFNLLLK